MPDLLARLWAWITSLFQRDVPVTPENSWRQVYAGVVTGEFSLPVKAWESHAIGLDWAYSNAQLYAENRSQEPAELRVSGVTFLLPVGAKLYPPEQMFVLIENGYIAGHATGPCHIDLWLF